MGTFELKTINNFEVARKGARRLTEPESAACVPAGSAGAGSLLLGRDFLHCRNSPKEKDGLLLPGALCANISFSQGKVSHSDHVLAPRFTEVTHVHAALAVNPVTAPPHHHQPDALFMS